MIVPEIILSRSLKTITEVLAKEYNDALVKSDTTIYRLFKTDDNGDNIVFGEKDSWLERAVDIFTRGNNHARRMSINIGYNLERRAFPTMHILLPSESKGRYDTIGNGMDGNDTTIDEPNGKVLFNIQKTRSANYQIMISSDNSMEVLIMYYYLSALLLLFNFHFEAKGLRNMQYGGGDLIFDEARVPANIYHRSINLSFDYEMNIKMALPISTITGMTANFCDDIDLHSNPKTNTHNVYPPEP